MRITLSNLHKMMREGERITMLTCYDASFASLLDSAGERAPFVMVGHSLGGALALMYAARYPERTAAVAMVDPPHPDLLSRIPRTAAADYRDFASKLRLASRLAPLGVMHAVRPFSGPAATLPEAGRHVAALLEVSPSHLRRRIRCSDSPSRSCRCTRR